MDETMIIVVAVGALLLLLLYWLSWWFLRYRSSFDPVKCFAVVQASGNVAAGDNVTVRIAFFGKTGHSLNGQSIARNAKSFTLKIYQEVEGSFIHIETAPLYRIYTENNVCYFRWVPKTSYTGNVHVVVCYNNTWIGENRFSETRVSPALLPTSSTRLDESDLSDTLVHDRYETSKSYTQHGKSSVTELTITPAQLKSIVYADGTILDEDLTCSPSEACHINIKGVDQFGNTSPLDTEQWYLEGQDQYGSVVDIRLCTVAVPSSEIVQFIYCFEQCGVYFLTIKSSIEHSELIVPESTTVWVTEPLHADGTHVIPYSIVDYMESVYPYNVIKVRDCARPILLGAGCSHMENINRVLDSDKRLTLDDFESNAANNADPIVFVHVSRFDEQQRLLIHKLLSLIIKGMHYRKQAFKLNKQRMKWKDKATKKYNLGDHIASKEAKLMKEECSKLMDEVHFLASVAIFRFFNFNRTIKEIDLHGQLVGDDRKLSFYHDQLLEKQLDAEETINKERYKMDEALRYVKARNVSQVQDGRDWLEIIVGAGHHSQDNRPKIKPKIEQFLMENNVYYQQCNKGSLLITYKEYSGIQPCYGTFYCKTCESSWESSASWKGCWQKCYKCDKRGVSSCCYPMKLSSTPTSRKRPANNKYESSNLTSHRSLCQKCLKTGRSCRFAFA